MNHQPQNSFQSPDDLKARKLYLSGIITVLAETKKLNAKSSKGAKVELLTIAAIQAEMDVIDLQLKRKVGH